MAGTLAVAGGDQRAGTTGPESRENRPTPISLTAATWNRYASPLVRPRTRSRVEAADALRRLPAGAPDSSTALTR
jgi:hypothetical protein